MCHTKDCFHCPCFSQFPPGPTSFSAAGSLPGNRCTKGRTCWGPGKLETQSRWPRSNLPLHQVISLPCIWACEININSSQVVHGSSSTSGNLCTSTFFFFFFLLYMALILCYTFLKWLYEASGIIPISWLCVRTQWDMSGMLWCLVGSTE